MYDAYSGHMSFQVLQLFRDNKLIVLAIPAHTSGELQPCDIVVFSVYKHALDDVIQDLNEPDEVQALSMFDYCACMRTAFYKSFTRENIIS